HLLRPRLVVQRADDQVRRRRHGEPRSGGGRLQVRLARRRLVARHPRRAGEMTVDPKQWPDGMKAVADYIHSKGLLAGIYTDAGQQGCGGVNEGSYGHYQQDANTFAAWGFDAVKVDYCGGTAMHLDPAQAYG